MCGPFNQDIPCFWLMFRRIPWQDPFFNLTSYTYDSIADVIMYHYDFAMANTTRMSPAYPLYSQCDPQWGNDVMESTTVCKVGCLMSSISSALFGKNISIAGQPSNPGTLNAWLRGHNGYDANNDLEVITTRRIGVSAGRPADRLVVGWLGRSRTFPTLRRWISSGRCGLQRLASLDVTKSPLARC